MTIRKRSTGPTGTRVILTERALNDLQEIEQHSVQMWGKATAAKYLSEFEIALDRLKDNPRLLRLEPDFFPGMYFYRVRKHILACDYCEPVIRILTVIHSSMDLPVRLAELEPGLLGETEWLQKKLRKHNP